MTKYKFQSINRSQLPFLASGLFASNLLFYLHPQGNTFLTNWDKFIIHISVIAINVLALSWLIIIILESGQGFHTLLVQKGFRFGFWLFLVSEAMIFFSFVWGYFLFSLNSSIAMEHQWPAELGTQHVDPYKIPLLNTILLLLCAAITGLLLYMILTTDDYSKNLGKFLVPGFYIAHLIIGITFLQIDFFKENTYSVNLCLATIIMAHFCKTIFFIKYKSLIIKTRIVKKRKNNFQKNMELKLRFILNVFAIQTILFFIINILIKHGDTLTIDSIWKFITWKINILLEIHIDSSWCLKYVKPIAIVVLNNLPLVCLIVGQIVGICWNKIIDEFYTLEHQLNSFLQNYFFTNK